MGREPEDLVSLIAGDKPAWDMFVARYAGLVVSAVRRVVGPEGEIDDIAQDVFMRLCKDDCRLLRQYDPTRAALSTWLTIIARSVAHDQARKRRAPAIPLDDVPEAALAVEPIISDKIRIPDGLLSPRQALVLTLLYERDLEVAEVAANLGIDAQTVRSTHHKAMLKLRGYFKENL